MKYDNGALQHESTLSEYERMVMLYEQAKSLKDAAYEKTIELANEVLRIAKHLNNIEYEIHAYTLIAPSYNSLENSDKAIQVASHGLSLIKQHRPNDIEQTLLLNFSLVYAYMNQGNLELAVDWQLKCLVLKKTAGAFVNLTLLYIRMGDNETAQKYALEGLESARIEQSAILEFKSLYNLGYLEFIKNNLDAAENWLDQLATFFKKVPSKAIALWKTQECVMLNLKAEIQNRNGNPSEALKIFDKAVDIAQSIKNIDVLCELLIDRANVQQTLGNLDLALIDLEKALYYADEYNNVFSINRILKKIVHFLEKQNQLEEAYPYLKRLNGIQSEKIKDYENKNLTKIISDREQEIHILEEKNKEIEEQNTILKQFAYVISHDLREPIRGITGFAQMLNSKYAENLDKTANEYLRFILSEAHSMNRNLARLLEYATIEKSTDNIKEINLQQIINETRQQYQDESFQLDISYKGVPIKMQHQHANILLSELIDNAVQFRKEGEDCRIEIKCELNEGHYRLSVKDYGIGIDHAYHDKVFKIFNKIDFILK